MSEELKNENIEVAVTRKPNCLVELAITATPSFGEAQYKQALKNVRKEVTFPGFRKGRAPDDMVKKQYGPQIDREFKELFLNESVKAALDLCRLYPWNRSERIKAEVNEASLEKGGKFSVSFESFPEIPDIDPKEIAIEKKEAKEITDEDVERHITALRYHHSDWKEIDSRPVRENDRVEVTVSFPDEENAEPEQNEFMVNKNNIEDWLYDLLIDKKAGDSQEITPPSDEGKSGKVSITVDKIKEAELKELDDEFVKNFGSESLDQFKEKVKEHLSQQEADRVENLIHQAIEKQLVSQYPFEVPGSLLEQEKQSILQSIVERLKNSQLSDEEITKRTDELEKAALDQALHNLRNHYILLKIAEEQQFKVSKEEVMNELIKSSIQANGSLNMEAINNPDKHAGPIIRRLQLIKAMEHLAENIAMK